MDINKYQKIVDKHVPKENKTRNLITSFVVGGIMGVLGNFILELYICFIYQQKKQVDICW